ncbi:MAG: Stk1 family PASTA domain-containing Ser/Thr kinase [Actinomycetota bacterium]|nr:Stk1 family PASTA domain-containing Ser/Thr kinase [Actinomycetota bacterium]
MTDTRVLSGRYRITRHLARGGMGDVFEAEDTLLGRRVAVKVLHEQFARDEAFVARFRREAQAAANLNHPNIVSIYDWGQEGSTYFMVMELIDGRTLREIRRHEGALLPRRAAEIVAEAAAALTVAHDRGVFHRDIKPGNIMVTPGGTVKVTDFGIARALDDSEELTKAGAVIGTATYFSPEQAQGLSADGRSDVYSLGVVLYELLCGRPPFQGDSPVAVAYQHVSEWAPPVSHYNPEVPTALESIVDRAMEKDPAARYQSADDMRHDLLGFLRTTTTVPTRQAETATRVIAAPAPLPPPPATVSPDETARHMSVEPEEERSRGGVIAGIVGLALLLIAGIVILWSLLGGGGTDLVTIPELRNQSEEVAVIALQDLELRVDLDSEANPRVAEGFVIRTNPEAGRQVEVGSLVTIIVSGGPGLLPVPNVLGMTQEDAIALIESQNFEVGDVTPRTDEDVAQGLVLEQDPEPGEEAAPGSAVDLVVSAGPFALIVPPVEGLSEEEAVRVLTDAELEVEIDTEFSEDIEEGFATRTDPRAGQLVARDAPTVVLFISEGPEPVAVPSFFRMTPEQATAAAAAAGLEVVFEDPVAVSLESGLAGLVAEQNPAAGSEAVAGDTVVLRLGALRTVEVPDLEGMTEQEAEEALEQVGLRLDVVGTVPIDDPSFDERVVGQDPAAGERIEEGSVVRVQIGVAPEATTTTTTTSTTTAP